jgi:hypothetical protein
VQERVGGALELNFLNRTPMTQQSKRIGKWDYIKLKSFCIMKEIISKLKNLSTK